MYKALTAAQSRELEQRAVDAGTSLSALMDAAGAALAEQVTERVPDGAVVVFAGAGNNGGDGWVAARLLRAAGRAVQVLSAVPVGALSGIAARAAERAIEAGVPWEQLGDAAAAPEAAVVIDALLGTGARLPLAGAYPAWCAAIGRSGAYVIAADVPTGVDSDTGAVDDAAVRADLTVTFSQPKLGLVTHPGAAYAGEIVVADIGIELALADAIDAPAVPGTAHYASLLPIPAPDAHKNSRGRVLVVAGSGRYPGAAVLCARGAQRMGAGYVTLAVPEPIVPIAQAHLLAVPVVGLPAARSRTLSGSAADAVLDLAHDYDAVVLGPGLTLADGAVATSRAIIAALERPLVVDADGLNALVDATSLLAGRRAATVLTPHPGELARLLGTSIGDVQADRVSSCAKLATGSSVVVLKGAGTVVCAPGRCAIVTSGSPALATAGTGDVLAGMTGALVAAAPDAYDAALLAAHLHGRAGESAAAVRTPLCVTAEDVPEHIPDAVAELLGAW